jgi:hypothetical protein
MVGSCDLQTCVTGEATAECGADPGSGTALAADVEDAEIEQRGRISRTALGQRQRVDGDRRE